MSMRQNPGSGYVVKLDDLKEAIIKALPEEEKAKFTKDLDAAIGEPDAVIEALTPYMEGMQLPIPEYVFELGADDERDLFPQALRLVRECEPAAVMLENVRGLSTARFAHYREQVLGQLHELGGDIECYGG